ncbi:MAG: hypothetical protein ACTHJT_16595 [Cytophaga sp.]|uniref:hypothetical protein n=1 Tax=Cytophaga sp. TaxID=29535 RepID=UPI003F807FC3
MANTGSHSGLHSLSFDQKRVTQAWSGSPYAQNEGVFRSGSFLSVSGQPVITKKQFLAFSGGGKIENGK